MSGLKGMEQNSTNLYHEESVKPVVAIMILAVCVIALPFGWFIYVAQQDSSRSVDLSKYNVLAEELQVKTKNVRKMLANEAVDETMLTQVAPAISAPLIIAEEAQTNVEKQVVKDPSAFDIVLKAIYWNPVAPLITVGDETYRVGERINGFKIVEIHKTSVVFESPLGDRIEKDFYDYLDNEKRK